MWNSEVKTYSIPGTSTGIANNRGKNKIFQDE